MIHVFRNRFPNVHTPGHLQKFQPNTRMCALSKFPANEVNRKVSTLFQHHNSSRKLHLCLYSWCGRSWRLQFHIIVPRQRTHKYSKVHMCGTKLTFCNIGWKEEKKVTMTERFSVVRLKVMTAFFFVCPTSQDPRQRKLNKNFTCRGEGFFFGPRRESSPVTAAGSRTVLERQIDLCFFFFCFLVPDPEPNGFRRFVLACRTKWCWFVNHEEFGGTYERGDVLGR